MFTRRIYVNLMLLLIVEEEEEEEEEEEAYSTPFAIFRMIGRNFVHFRISPRRAKYKSFFFLFVL